MKPKIKLFVTAFLCSISSVLSAQPVDIHTAITIAEHHLAAISGPSLKSAGNKGKNFQFTSVKATVENKDTLYYILNDTINKGFVIVSADKRAWPILGYSTEGSFNEKKQPEAFTAWMENRKKEIESIKRDNLQPDSATMASWQNLSLKSASTSSTSVEPLIQTQWDQGCYYNTMCPADAAGPCGHAVAGCTITAMAQIMKYWNYPTKGTGSHAYNHPTYGHLSADFGSTTYQWSQMPNIVTSQNDAVATLMYHCGVSLDVDYGPNGSGAWDPRDALVQYFNYSSNAMLVNRSGFSTNEWINLLKSELDLQHPIWYTGSGGLVGHSFICDGYQDADYFHFNWGWSGSFDGYFYIGNLNPGWNDFNENQSALINMIPGNLPDGYNGFFLSSNALDIATTGGTASVVICSSANWTASTDQTWFSLSTSSGGSGKTTITITAPENQTGSDRSAKVTISSAGFDPQTITVNQLAKVNVTAGNLYNLMANKASRITHLTLTGTIDARDFKTMRDAMPALKYVDLSNAIIVAYNGTEGTSNFENKTYPANRIPDNAFSKAFCMGKIFLEEFILPRSINSIGEFSFSGCSYLRLIDIPASVNYIGLAFEQCSAFLHVDKANSNYSSIDGVLFDKNQKILIQCPTSKTGNYMIPSSVTSIKNFAFESCGKLSSINIPSSLTLIEQAAFRDCNASIVVEENNLNFSGIDGVLFNKEQTTLIYCPGSKTGSYTIPSSVSSIEKFAFYHCTALTNISMATSINFIGSGAFNGCSKLTTMTIPSSVIYIGEQAFYSCKGLLDLTIPLSIKSIGFGAFSYCTKLNSIHVYPISPIDLNSSSDVFMNINKNTCALYVPFSTRVSYQEANQWKDFVNIVEMPGIFLSKSSLGIGSIGKTTQVAITSSSNWTATSDQPWLTLSPSTGITGSDTITFNAPANPTIDIRIANVTISAVGIASQTITVTQYGSVVVTAGNLKDKLGGQLATITSLTLSGTIDARDFKTMRDEMPALTDIDLSGVTIVAYSGTEGTDRNNGIYAANCIPSFAFYNYDAGKGNTVLRSVVLPLSVTSIGSFAFFYCTNLNSINIPPSVISIEFLAFSSCTGLSTINIPASVNLIDKTAFDGFSALITVAENNLVYSAIDGILFNKNQTTLIKCPVSKTGYYSIPSSVTSIQYYAFASCQGLTKVTIPSSVNSIEGRAFSFCTNLSSIISERTNPIYLDSSIGVFEFVNKKTCTLYVPYGAKPAYQAANQWKDFTNIVELPNQAPVANAGTNQTTHEGTLVTLDGTGSTDIDGNSLTFKWTAPTGITLNATTVSKPTFTAPYVVTSTNFTFSLIVNDGVLDSPVDQVIVTVTPNKSPTANAGTDQSVNEKSLCSLDGSASSDSENDGLTYLWTAPTGITLSSNTAPKPTFTAPEVTTDTNYTFSLVVNDGSLNSTADQIVITVKNIDKAPYLKNPIKDISVDKRASDQTIDLQTVFADDDLGDILSYIISSNTNIQVVTTKISGSFLSLNFSTLYTGSSEIVVTANSNGKEVTTKFNVEVKIPTGIDPFESYQDLKMYPNPTTGKIKLVFDKIPLSGILVTVNDITGKICLKQPIREKESWIDLSGNVPGIYFIKTDQENFKAQKVILK
jgi:hypothetical protein